MSTQALDSDIEVLRQVPFFAGFSDEHLKLLALSSENRSLPEKLLLYDDGQLLHSAYVVVSGALRGEHKVKDTDKVIKRDIGPGVILGERALLLDTRATESVRVESRARVLQLRKLAFRKLLQEHVEIAKLLRTRLTRHVLQVTTEFNVVGERLRAIDASLR
jgi:CRP-like cAMP-binding protein